jgi:anthranilate synthase
MLQHVKTKGGVRIELQQHSLAYDNAMEPLVKRLDAERGGVFASGFEYPGRYTCWDIGFCNPPLAFICKGQTIQVQALNQRGEQLMRMILPVLHAQQDLVLLQQTDRCCELSVIPSDKVFNEEERSQQPSVFSLIRAMLTLFKLEDEAYLGLYGAFGYDLIFQFETIERYQERSTQQRDMVLYLPDEIYVVNHRKEEAFVRRYEFELGEHSTRDLPREGEVLAYAAGNGHEMSCDHAPHEYEQLVEIAKTRFACGDLFEVVPSQTFFSHSQDKPSLLFERLRIKNPSPYGFLINLGEGEYLVGASPEMYVRVQGRRVETAPISGTIRRGEDAIEDALNIQTLLASEKEASELTMCTDVDRNDKSRICEAGSVQVIGRRQIELYSRLIHTVDHVEGYMREGFDAVDAFLTHMWVVTVTGAPKLWAMNFIEQHEKSPRKWYAGAVGWFNFNGDLNTGLVLRTIRIQDGVAEVRVGATLLYDSVPEAEEQETRLKASAFLDILQSNQATKPNLVHLPQHGVGKTVLLIDHQDSFVHTLANYLRQTGASVETVRFDHALTFLNSKSYDLVLLSPGPGQPSDFSLTQTIEAVLARSIPLFGVCLGLQGIVEYFGGQLDVLDYPMHGKASTVHVRNNASLFAGFDATFTAARYHSLHARLATMPEALMVTATSDDGVVMAIAHRTFPIQAVQFHPEAILSLPQQAGLRIMSNLMVWVNGYA